MSSNGYDIIDSEKISKIQRELQELLETIPQKWPAPYDAETLATYARQREFHMELPKIQALLNDDPTRIAQGFRELCTQRAEQNQGTLLDITINPSTPTNELYWKLASHLFAPPSLADMLLLLLPGCKRVYFECDSNTFLALNVQRQDWPESAQPNVLTRLTRHRDLLFDQLDLQSLLPDNYLKRLSALARYAPDLAKPVYAQNTTIYERLQRAYRLLRMGCQCSKPLRIVQQAYRLLQACFDEYYLLLLDMPTSNDTDSDASPRSLGAIATGLNTVLRTGDRKPLVSITDHLQKLIQHNETLLRERRLLRISFMPREESSLIRIPDEYIRDAFSKITLLDTAELFYWLDCLDADHYPALLQYTTFRESADTLAKPLRSLIRNHILTDAQEHNLCQAVVANPDKMGGMAHVLNLATQTLSHALLDALIAQGEVGHSLDSSFLDKACQHYTDARDARFLLTLFDQAHYPEQQRLNAVQRLVETARHTHDTSFLPRLFSRLHPVEEMMPLATLLLDTRFTWLCNETGVLSPLLRYAPENERAALCQTVMTRLQSERHARSLARKLLKHPDLPDPLLQAMARFLFKAKSRTSDTWQSVFSALTSQSLASCQHTLVTGHNLASLLLTRKKDQRWPLLQTLAQQTSVCFQQLGQNAAAMQQVLTLLPESQRAGLFQLPCPDNKRIGDYISDALWPVIAPLLKPSDLVAIVQHKLTDYAGENVGHILGVLPDDDFWHIWQSLPEQQLSNLLSSPQHLSVLLHHVPETAQRRIADQFLARLLQQHRQRQHSDQWLDEESYFSALFPAASRWLNTACDTQNLPFGERLAALATTSAALYAFLDQIPASERQVLIPRLASVDIQDADILTSVLDRYPECSCLDYVMAGSWARTSLYWAEKMPLIMAILERLPQASRPDFIKRLPGMALRSWDEGNHQTVRRARELFGESVSDFLRRVGLYKGAAKSSITPLMHAVRYNNREQARLALLDNGHSLNAQDTSGETALMQAYKHKHLDMAIYLAEQPDCDFSPQTLNDETVFAFAVATKDTFAIHHLLKISPRQPTVNDALAALSSAQYNDKLINFIFDAYLPNVTWRSTSHTIPGRYQHESSFRTYCARAILPADLANHQLSELVLDLEQPGLFRYQMQALGIHTHHATNLAYLLKALTGRVPQTLRLSGFHIHEHELPELLEFVNNNHQLKTLCLDTLHLYPEDAQDFARDLGNLAVLESAELTVYQQPTIRLCLPKPVARGGFFEQSVKRGTVVDAQASCSLRL